MTPRVGFRQSWRCPFSFAIRVVGKSVALPDFGFGVVSSTSLTGSPSMVRVAPVITASVRPAIPGMCQLHSTRSPYRNTCACVGDRSHQRACSAGLPLKALRSGPRQPAFGSSPTACHTARWLGWQAPFSPRGRAPSSSMSRLCLGLGTLGLQGIPDLVTVRLRWIQPRYLFKAPRPSIIR